VPGRGRTGIKHTRRDPSVSPTPGARPTFGNTLSRILDEYLDPPADFTDRLQFGVAMDREHGIRRTCTGRPDADRDTVLDAAALKARIVAEYDGTDRPESLIQPPGTTVTAGEQDTAGFIEDAADVFCVGDNAPRRWRSYVNADVWNPSDHHDELLRHRAYHGRMVYELSLLLEMCSKDWVSMHTLDCLRTAGLVKLRAAEIHIASFQLSTKQVGMRKDPDRLYAAARFAHSTHLHLYDVACGLAKVKNGRKDILSAGPTSVDNPKQLVKVIDHNVHGCYMFMKLGMADLLGGLEDLKPAREMAQRLGFLVRALDDVLVVL